MILLRIVFLSSLVLLLHSNATSTASADVMNSTAGQHEVSRREALDEAVEVEGLIRLDLIITDETGKAVNGLGRNDFTVLDNGHPQKVVAFRPSSATSAQQEGTGSLIILLDTLNLQPALAAHERQQAETFLRQNSGHLAQPVTIYSLDNTGFYLTAAASADGFALADKVVADGKVEPQFLISPRHQQAQVPSVDISRSKPPIYMGLLALGVIGGFQERLPGKKLLLWIGPDGVGTGAYPEAPYSPSGTFLHSVSDKLNNGETSESLFGKAFWFSILLRQARISIDVLSTLDDKSDVKYRRAGPDAWKQFLLDIPTVKQANWMDLFKKVLAVQSGGSVLPESTNLVQQMNDCAHDTDNYYSLTFNPSLATKVDEFHSLQVQVGKPNLTVRTNTGYYDQPFFSDPPDPGIRKVTAAEVEEIVRSVHGDGNAMRQLSNLALSERMSNQKFKLLATELPGKKSRAQLEMIADESATLSTVSSDILADPSPDAAMQKHFLVAASNYLEHVLPTLPDFFASRTAVHYRETAAYQELDTAIQPSPLHESTRSESTVLYRDGHEIVEDLPNQRPTLGITGLETRGIFGPILNFLKATLDLPGAITWSHWEHGESGRQAVFQYAYLGTPSVEITGCCSPGGKGKTTMSSGFHGEIAIDPENGAILRFEMLSNLQDFVPTEHSDMTVTYGPVEIGGKTYILPTRSVNMWRARTVPDLKLWNLDLTTWGPYQTQMNVFTFDRYHAFRGTSRVLPGFTN